MNGWKTDVEYIIHEDEPWIKVSTILHYLGEYCHAAELKHLDPSDKDEAYMIENVIIAFNDVMAQFEQIVVDAKNHLDS